MPAGPSRQGSGMSLYPDEMEQVSLCEALDRILNKGAVISGAVTISVANIDLIYLGLQMILSSLETARELRSLWGEEPDMGTAR
jgi:gas vesicle structural protein